MTKLEQAKARLRPDLEAQWATSASLRAEFGDQFERCLSCRAAEELGLIKVLGEGNKNV